MYRLKVFVAVLNLLATAVVFAQPKDNAPYSRLGLGEPAGLGLSATGFGGLSAAYADPLHINLLNPASYGQMRVATFEAGLFAEQSVIKSNDQKTNVWTGNLSHLSLALPMRNPLNDLLAKKKRDFFWGMNLALLPVSSVGYDIETTEIHPEVDTTVNAFQGTGGVNKFLWGNGFTYKNFSFGFNLGYLFGQLEGDRKVTFRNLEAAYGDKFEDDITIRGFRWNLGAQYRFDLDKKATEGFYQGKSLIVGVYGNTATGFSTQSTVNRIRENFVYSPVQSDTIYSEKDVKGDGKLPAEWTAGLVYQKTDKWRIGIEYGVANWSNYENDAKPETLFDSRRIAVGAEFIPNATSYNNYLQRIRYRAGFYHRTDPRLEDLNQYALTFGLGLPVILPRQQTSFVNLAFEIGRYDTSGAIEETFVKMSLGFTLNDSSWFFKRKFN
jgi:hypothetical protein